MKPWFSSWPYSTAQIYFLTKSGWINTKKNKLMSTMLPVVVKVWSIHHSSCSVPVIRQFVLLTSNACFEHVHVFKFFKLVSPDVARHNEYGLGTHDTQRIFHPRSLSIGPSVVSHRLANGLNVSAAICEKVEKVNLIVRYSLNAQLKRQSNSLTVPLEVKWSRYERQTPDHALNLCLSRLSQCQFLATF